MTAAALRRGKPATLQTSYADSVALFSGGWRKLGLVVTLALLLAAPMPFSPVSDFNATLATAAIAAIGAIGLNILSGYTGQVSLGHAAFLGIGAFTAAWFTIDAGLPFLLTIPLAGLAAAIVGLIIGPVAFRLKGLYLSIVTLGLVFIVQHVLRAWESVSEFPDTKTISDPEVFGIPLDPGLLDREILGVVVDKQWRIYYLALAIAIIGAWVARNIQRTRTGRSMMAVRDRDIAAAMTGVNVRRVKLVAFAVSSFYAGVAGALVAAQSGSISPERFDLATSIEFVAMIVIGGIGTVFGGIWGAIFVVAIPTLVEQVLTAVVGEPEIGSFSKGEISAMIYGLVLILFLLFEPLGLYGIWLRIRAYFSAWPFRY